MTSKMTPFWYPFGTIWLTFGVPENQSENGHKSIKHGSKIEAMMIGSKIAFWRHFDLPKLLKMEFGKPPRASPDFGPTEGRRRGV